MLGQFNVEAAAYGIAQQFVVALIGCASRHRALLGFEQRQESVGIQLPVHGIEHGRIDVAAYAFLPQRSLDLASSPFTKLDLVVDEHLAEASVVDITFFYQSREYTLLGLFVKTPSSHAVACLPRAIFCPCA